MEKVVPSYLQVLAPLIIRQCTALLNFGRAVSIYCTVDVQAHRGLLHAIRIKYTTQKTDSYLWIWSIIWSVWLGRLSAHKVVFNFIGLKRSNRQFWTCHLQKKFLNHRYEQYTIIMTGWKIYHNKDWKLFFLWKATPNSRRLLPVWPCGRSWIFVFSVGIDWESSVHDAYK